MGHGTPTKTPTTTAQSFGPGVVNQGSSACSKDIPPQHKTAMTLPSLGSTAGALKNTTPVPRVFRTGFTHAHRFPTFHLFPEVYSSNLHLKASWIPPRPFRTGRTACSSRSPTLLLIKFSNALPTLHQLARTSSRQFFLAKLNLTSFCLSCNKFKLH